MKKLFSLIGWLIKLFGSALIFYLLYIVLQGGSITDEISSWFENEPTLESVMQENSMTREEAFDYLMDTTDPNELPGIPEELTDHVFLNARAAGVTSKLIGDVRVIVVFVTNPASSWTYEEMTEVQTGHEAMTAEILAKAAAYGVSLDLSMEYHLATVDMEFPDEDIDLWVDAALASVGLPPSATASADLEAEYGVDEAPILFYLNHSGRPYALPYQRGDHSEYAFIFANSADVYSAQHEMYHLFGAKDYYYPAEVQTLAQEYFSNSVMLTSTTSFTDELTAYLIGWTNIPSDQSLDFLQKTAHLTAEQMKEEHETETYTGYIEDYADGDGTYTGYLDFGVPQGYGTKVWDDGRRYEGEWDYGTFHGEGTYTWPNGNSYTGEFTNGRLNGEGTFIWYNGDTFTGEWVEGQRTGYGTYTWADGSTRSGYWENDEFIE